MINKIKSRFRKYLIKTKVLETFSIDDTIYKIVDRTSFMPNIKNTRRILFKKDNHIYSHSAIYLNPKHHFQPALLIPQKVISIWSQSYSFNSALILGCAGCCVPRFIGLHYPKSKTVGVEISEYFIEIAKKHFLLDQIENQFELIQGDAINYVKNYNLDYKQSVIYIDIFCANKIIPDIFTENFINAAYNATSENGMIIINILGENNQQIKSFFNNIKTPFNNIFITKNANAKFVVLTKTTNPKKEKDFINKLNATKDITVLNWLEQAN